MASGQWTVFVGHLNVTPTIRKYKTFEINKKIRMDSCPEFTAQIEYSSDVTFNDIITFKRDGTVEWKGFVEDMEIAWDANGRYLNLGGRDMSFLLWRKYVENFNNAIKDTGGFFGTVSASELVKFLLRTPRSDLPVSSDQDSDPLVPYVSKYPYNKEGWGLDASRFTELIANRTGYGDIESAILRTRNLYWSNSNTPYNSQIIEVDSISGSSDWTLVGASPYLDTDDGSDSYIESQTTVPDTSYVFSFHDLDPTPQTINNCTLVIRWHPHDTLDMFQNSDCEVLLWIDSESNWETVGSFGGRAPPWSNPWQTAQFDVSSLFTGNDATKISDINAAQIKFIEHGELNTYITYVYLSIGCGTSGTQDPTKDWVNIKFDAGTEDIMGIYVECREHANNFPRNYKVVTDGADEPFDNYTNYDSSDASHIQLSSDKKTLTYNAYQTDGMEVGYFVRDYGTTSGNGNITDGFDESFSFKITDSLPHPFAYVPFCISTSNDTPTHILDYKTLLNEVDSPPIGYLSSIEVENSHGTLFLHCRLKVGNDPISVWGYVGSGLDISLNTQYWVRVTIVGTDLRYRIYNAATMRDGIGGIGSVGSDLVYDTDNETIGVGWNTLIPTGSSSPVTFEYRYQAFTYNAIEWATVFYNDMEYFGIDGENVNDSGFESGWGTWDHSGASIVTTQFHSGTHSAELPVPQSATPYIKQDFDNIPKSYATSFGLWCKAIFTSNFTGTRAMYVILRYSDSSNYLVTIPNPSNAWAYIDLLSSWTNGKLLHQIEIIGNNDTNLGAEADYYIDDISLILDLPEAWTTSDGTATRTTDYTIYEDSSGSSQKIAGTADDQGFYFEKNITPVDYVDIDAWVDLPQPKVNTGVNEDLSTNGWDANHAGTYTWLKIGSSPYLNDNYPTDYIYGGNAGTYKDEWYFSNPSWWVGGAPMSFAPNTSNTHMYIKAQLNAPATSCFLKVWIWIQHLNGGAGDWDYWNSDEWTSTSWATQTIPITNYLTSLDDYVNAKMRIDIVSINAGTISICRAYTHIEGTRYQGSIELIKLFNHAVGSDPSTDYIALASVRVDSTATSDQDKWRVYIDGYNATGVIGTTPISYSIWTLIRFQVRLNSSAGYLKFYVSSFSDPPECSIIGINNSGWGQIDRVDVEANYSYCGNGAYTYWNFVTIQSMGSSYTDGVVYSGKGADIILVDAYDKPTSTTLTSDITTFANTTLLSQDAQPSDVDIYVVDSSAFSIGEAVTIKDSNFFETNAIANKFTDSNGNYVVTLQTPLANSYLKNNTASMNGPTVSGEPTIYITDSTAFLANEPISIYDDLNSEPNVIDTIIQVQHLTLLSGGYIDCVPSDIGKMVHEHSIIGDSVDDDIGPLVSYDNSSRIWVVNGTSSIPLSIVIITITDGTGQGTGLNLCSPHCSYGIITLLNPLVNSYSMANNAGIKGPCNIYPDIIHSWDPQKLTNIKIQITDDSLSNGLSDVHAWEISQIYVYKTDQVKYRVADASTPYEPVEIKLTFDPSGYQPCLDNDIGKQVHVNGIDIGELLWFNNGETDSSDSSGEYVWHVASSSILTNGTSVTITNGTGYGTLNANAVSVYAGGPYLTIGTELEPSTVVAFEYSTPIGPLNIPKNRLLDALWDLSNIINDAYLPYEWWITYEPDTFHIGSRRGSDMSGSVSFVTGTTPATNNGVLGGVKYQKSSRDTYQRIQVIGQGEGQGQDATSSFWATDEDAEDEINGFIEFIYTQKQVNNAKIANRYSKIQLRLNASPKRKNGITCTVDYDGYPSGTYDVGDDVTLTDVLTGLNGSYRIWNSKVTVNENGEVPTLTCQAPYLDIGNVWSQIWKELKNLGIIGGIAQDWAGEGTNASKVAPDKMSTLFTVTAKNEEKTGSDPKDSPNWWIIGEPDDGTTTPSSPTVAHCSWDSGNSQLKVGAGDGSSPYIGYIEISADWAGAVSNDGTTVYKSTSDSGYSSAHLIPVNILINQNPKFTAEFMVWEAHNGLMGSTTETRWKAGDYADFGPFDHVTRTGFFIRIYCKAAGVFLAYAVYLDGPVLDSSGANMEKNTDYLFTYGYAKLIRQVAPNTKYKIEIIVDCSEPSNRLPKSVKTVMFNIYDEGTTDLPNGNPKATQISAVFVGLDPSLSIKPIYICASGAGGTLSGGKYSAIIHFYNIKCEDDVI